MKSLNTILEEEALKLGFIPRTEQYECVQAVYEFLKTKSKYLGILAPTAVGKSLIIKTIAEFTSQFGNSAIITPSNVLVEQYKKDFNDINVFYGKGNFYCENLDLTCKMASLFLEDLGQTCTRCPYDLAKNEALSRPYSLFNTASWFYFKRYKKDEEDGTYKCVFPINTLIVDEAHELGTFLTSFGEMTIWESDVSWRKGISGSRIEVIKILNKFVGILDNNNKDLIVDKSLENLKKISENIQQIRKLSFIADELSNPKSQYVVEEIEAKNRTTIMKCLRIRPIIVSQKVLKKFFYEVKRVIFLSGTLLPIHLQELQIDECTSFEVKSPIPIENRKIHILPRVDCSYARKDDYPKELAAEILKICKEKPKERGLVLVSYADAERLKEYLTLKRFVFNTRNTKKKDLEDFLEIKPNDNRVGVFAASNTGLDLKDDLCRFIIIPKVQLASFADNLVKRKLEIFKSQKWYSSHGMLQVIQGSARGCRHETDYCEIFILDKNFYKYYNDCKELLPNYFKESLIHATT